VYPGEVALSVAPLHHTYETTVGLLVMMYSGVAIAYNTSLKRLQTELKLFRPTIMAVVPLILETFRNVIIKKYNKIKGGRAVLALQRFASDVTQNKAGKKIFGIVNETFGGRMRLLVCGAALLSPDVFRDYERFGIKVLIGYGLTETAPVSAMHSDFYNAPDDIGYPVSGVHMKLDEVNEDGVGELLIKGPNVMLGYYKNPEETARVMTEDGYFRTGDLATMKPNGAFRIVGRAKSMIVSPGGKKIFPEELELYLERSEYVKESLVYEPDKNEPGVIAAAIIPDDDNVKDYLSKQGLDPADPEYSVAEKRLFNDIVREQNLKFPHYKHIQKVYVRRRDFVKTTTRKIKRNDEDNINNDNEENLA
jgi:long-chain acyl-CoA synthetase